VGDQELRLNGLKQLSVMFIVFICWGGGDTVKNKAYILLKARIEVGPEISRMCLDETEYMNATLMVKLCFNVKLGGREWKSSVFQNQF
jgi:hypothetical protein